MSTVFSQPPPFHIDVVEILLVEDNAGDLRLTKEALNEAKIINRLNVVRDGVEAMRFLRQQDEFKAAPRPHLVLLDLNLPKKSGLEVLNEIKSDAHLKDIPVVILTTSSSEIDVLKSYQCHANCYITKPVDFNQFIDIVKAIEGFWLGVVRLPAHQDGGL